MLDTLKKVDWIQYDDMIIYKDIGYIELRGCICCIHCLYIRENFDGKEMHVCKKHQVEVDRMGICKDFEDDMKND